MAIIFADDFKQWPAGGILSLAAPNTSWQGATATAVLYSQRIEALGYFYPAQAGTGGDIATYWGTTLRHNSTKDCAIIMSQTSVGNFSLVLGASGLRRKISYKGDTLFVGLCFEFTDNTAPVGNFLYFGPFNTSVNEFTATDGVLANNFTHVMGVDANGMFTFNGKSVGVPAYYSPATVKHFVDVVFKPEAVEVWFNNEMVYTEPNSNVKIREMALTASNIGATNFGIYLYSLGIADDSGGFGQRFGRKTVRTQQVQTILSTLTKTASPAATTELALIRKMADDPWASTGTNMLGHLSALDGYVGADITVPGFTGREVVYGAALQVQSKRLSPSGSGLGVLPYVTVAGVKKYGVVNVPSSTWKQHTLEVPMTDVPKETTTFGFMFDYADVNKLYIDDRQKIEVYGEPEPTPLLGYLGEVIYSAKNVVNTAYQSVAPEYMQQTLDTSAYTVNPTEWKANVFSYGQQTMTTAMYDVANTSYSKEEI